AVLVGPGEAVDLALLDLVFQELADRGVVTDERLVGDQWREEGERLGLFARQAGRVLTRALGHEERRLHPTTGDDGNPHGKHEARDEPQVLPEMKHAD